MRNSLILIFSISILLTSCFDPSKPNFQYFPDMYESLAYETYAESEAFSNGIEAQLPPEGSIARGWEPYDYEDSNEGYELAKAQLYLLWKLMIIIEAKVKSSTRFIVLYVMEIKEMEWGF